MTKQTDDLFDDEVTTGATLDSGTTVGGNQVYHLGNDGQGSGLDAETVDGKEPVQKGQKYTSNPITQTSNNSNTGSLIQSIDSPSYIYGAAYENSTDCVWLALSNSIYVTPQQSTADLSTGFASPCASGTSGIDIDESTSSIWHHSFSADSIWEINQSGTVQRQWNSMSNDGVDLAVSNNGCIWHTDKDFENQSIYQFDQNGNKINSFPPLSDDPYGISTDPSDSLWYHENTNSIYKISKSDGTQQSYYVVNDSSWIQRGISIDSSGDVWSTNDDVFEFSSNEKFTEVYRLNKL